MHVVWGGGGERLTKIKPPQDPTMSGQRFGRECQKQLNEKKSSSGLLRKRSSTRHSSIDPEDMEFREAVKTRKKLEWTVESDMPCKVENLRRGACDENKPNTRRSGCACIVEAHESTRKRLEKTQPKDHEDRSGEKAFNSLSHCKSSCTRSFLCPEQ